MNAAGPEQAYIDTDTTMTEGTTRYYSVMGKGTNGNSPYTDAVSRPRCSIRPEDVIANALNGHEVDVFWSDNSLLETGYSIQEDFGDGDWEEVGWVPAAANSGTMEAAVDGTFAPSTSYDFRVVAYSDDNQSLPSAEYTVTIGSSAWPDAPSEPGGDAQYQQPGSPFDLDRGHRGGTLYCRQPRRILGRGVGYRAPR